MKRRHRIALGTVAVLVSVYLLVGTSLTERIPETGLVVVALLPAGIALLTSEAGRALRRIVDSS